MDVSEQGEQGPFVSPAAHGEITRAGGGRRTEKRNAGGNDYLENGFYRVEGVSRENVRKAEETTNGNLEFHDQELIFGRLRSLDKKVDGFGMEFKPNKRGDGIESHNGETMVTGTRLKIQIDPPEDDVSGENISVSPRIDVGVPTTAPHSQLPKPQAPQCAISCPSHGDDRGREVQRSTSLPGKTSVDMPALGKFIREKRNSFSAAIAKRFSSLKERENEQQKPEVAVTEIDLSGVKVVVKKKDDEETGGLKLKGRVTFFSRSNCRDCSAVRAVFRERGLKFVEINVDVYPMRERELIQRTGSAAVPQIFFNEKLFGGLVALNSLRNGGQLEQRLVEMLGRRCPDDAPAPPVYGFDDPEEEQTDEMIDVVKVLRQKLPIQDRLMKMRIVKNCFSGSEMVEVLINHLDCGRRKAVEVGKKAAARHFIHDVFGQKDFEDGNNFYRFLEHESFIPKCHNFRGSTNDNEPKSAAAISQRLAKIMFAILESYASEDRCHLNYMAISQSEEFRRFVNLAEELQRLSVQELSADERLAFFLNLYNAMVIHAVIRMGHAWPGSLIDQRYFYSDFQYIVGGHAYSLSMIKNGILRGNQRAPYSLVKPFGAGEKRLELAVTKVNPLIHFGLCDGTRSSPTVRIYTPQIVEAELKRATREFLQRNGMEVDLEKRNVHLTRIIKWYTADFGQEKQILKWILNYLDATKAGLLTHLLADEDPINIVYQDYDWSVNSY